MDFFIIRKNINSNLFFFILFKFLILQNLKLRNNFFFKLLYVTIYVKYKK